MKKIYVLLFTILSSAAEACRPVHIPLEERVASAEVIITGFVTGITFTEFENRRKSEPQRSGIQKLSVPDEYELRVLVKEEIKGNVSSEIINMFDSGCGGGSEILKDRIIAFYSDNYWHVRIYDEKEYSEVIAALEK